MMPPNAELSQGYLLSTLLKEVAQYYQKLTEAEGQEESQILPPPWQFEALQQCLKFHLEQTEPPAWPYTTSVFDANGKKVMVKFNGNIIWRLSKSFFDLSQDHTQVLWRNPNRAEITVNDKDDTSTLGSGAFATVKKVQYSIKLCGTDAKVITYVKVQSNKVLKQIHCKQKEQINIEDITQEVIASKEIYQQRVHNGKTLANYLFFNSIILPLVSKENMTSFLLAVQADEKKKGIYHVFPDSIKIIMQHITCSLRRIHAKGFLHNDVKPDNCMIDSNFYAIFVDFGFANTKLNNDNLRHTPLYAAPEILLRKNFDGNDVSSSPAHEVYSLAIFFLEMYGINIQEQLIQFNQYYSGYKNAGLDYREAVECSFYAKYNIGNEHCSFPFYVHHCIQEVVQHSNYIPKDMKVIFLKMLSFTPEARLSLDEVTKNLLEIINTNDSGNNNNNESSNDRAHLYVGYCTMYQIMMWNLVCTEVFIITTRTQKLNYLSDEGKQILVELEQLAYVNQNFNALVPEDKSKTIGQYKFEQLPLFAKKNESIKDNELKNIFTILAKINTETAIEDVYLELLECSNDFVNKVEEQVPIVPGMRC